MEIGMKALFFGITGVRQGYFDERGDIRREISCGGTAKTLSGLAGALLQKALKQ
jgi:hypothetical protein